MHAARSLLARGASIFQREHPAAFVDTVKGYLSMVEQMRKIMDDPVATIIVAHHDLREMYTKKGDKGAAIEQFQKTLKTLKDPTARTAVRFALADMYRETGHPDKAVVQLRTIIDENQKRLESQR